MLDSLCPRDIRDVNEAVYSVFDFDECSEVCQRADLSGHSRTYVVAHRQCFPRIGGDLFETEAYAAAVRIRFENNCLDVLSDREQLGRVLQSLGPGHLGYMDKAFDAGFNLDERSVIGKADDLASDMRALGKALGHALPRVG